MLAIAVLACVGLRLAADRVFALPGSSTQHYDNAVALALPIAVVNGAFGGWRVVVVFWCAAALLAWLGWRFGGALVSESPGGLRAVIAAQAVILFALSLCPVMFSADPYAYVIWARLYGIHSVNPYELVRPVGALKDGTIDVALRYFGDPPPSDDYGPLWTLGAGLIAKMQSHLSIWFQVWTQRLLAGVAAVVAAAGIATMVRRARPETAARRTAAFALHPLVLFETAVNGHNDMLMVAPAVWAFAVAESYPLLAGLLLGAAVSVKYVALVALPFLAVRASKGNAVRGFLCAICAIAVIALLFQPFWNGARTLYSVVGHGGLFGFSPTWLINYPFFAHGVQNRSAFAGLPALPFFGTASWPRLVQLGLLCAFIAIAVWSWIRYITMPAWSHLWRSITALLWASPIIDPWYVTWLAPAAANGGRWATYAWWFAALVMLRYVVDVVAPQEVPLALYFLVTLIFLGVPVFIARLRRST